MKATEPDSLGLVFPKPRIEANGIAKNASGCPTEPETDNLNAVASTSATNATIPTTIPSVVKDTRIALRDISHVLTSSSSCSMDTAQFLQFAVMAGVEHAAELAAFCEWKVDVALLPSWLGAEYLLTRSSVA